jgi:nucleoside-diphosphate-sugar epimerase
MRILVLGGTRNLGHDLVLHLVLAGHRVTVLNRGVTPDSLPPQVERLRADRTDANLLTQAVGSRTWDGVVDLTLYRGAEAEATVRIFAERTAHYVFISTGQVYLVREGGAPRPAREDDYAGPIMAEPPTGSRDHANWTYGVEKRAAEDVLARAWADRQFPYTSLRLPMINSRRDHYGRLHGYLLRLRDGGPILVPDSPAQSLRHIFGDDVVRTVARVLESRSALGEALNLSQDETLSLEEFLALVAASLPGYSGTAALVRRPLELLEREQLFPGCSPFSDTWMSALDNQRSKAMIGVTYTSPAVYVPQLVRYYLDTNPPAPAAYAQRARERELARETI